MRERLVRHADEILKVAESVPRPRQAAEWLAAAGGAVRPGELGVPEMMERDSLHAVHYVRNRMTVLRLLHALSIEGCRAEEEGIACFNGTIFFV
jgi:hypothetical protein